ncbi:MAG: DUF4340 domain-containing protein [Ruminococcus sp.]|nr:DUF4340 domain-containing protein [Ruminococcus sp.]
MNSKFKGIIICAVVAVCLGVMLLVLNLLPQVDDDSSSEESSTVETDDDTGSISLTSDVADELDSTNVAKIGFHNSFQEIEIVQTTDGEDEWEIEELDGINQNQTLYSSVATTLCSLAAKEVVEEDTDDLEKYGLDEVSCYFDVTFDCDGEETEKSFLVGDESPESGYYYVCEAGSTKVYTVYSSNLSYFFYTKEEFISLSMLSSLPSDADDDYFTTLTVKQKDRDYDIVFENADDSTSMVSAQVMTSPIFSYLDVSNSSTVTHGMWGLAAEYAIVAKPDDDDFATYGLDDPTAVADLVCDDGEYILTIGNCEYATDSEGNSTETIDGYYVYLEGVEGIDVIFYCAADDLPWADFDPSDIISGLMTTNNVVTLKDIKVTTADEEVVYDLTITEDDDGDEEVESVVENEETQLDAEVWKGWYQLLIQCPTSEIYFTDPESDTADLTIEIDLIDGGGDVMELYKETDRRYIVKLNGKTSFRIESAWVDAILEGMEKVRNGEEVNADTY